MTQVSFTMIASASGIPLYVPLKLHCLCTVFSYLISQLPCEHSRSYILHPTFRKVHYIHLHEILVGFETIPSLILMFKFEKNIQPFPTFLKQIDFGNICLMKV